MRDVFIMLFYSEVLELPTLITCQSKKYLKYHFCAEKQVILSSTGLKPEK